MNEEENVEVQLQTAEWVLKVGNNLLKKHKKCKTENCKAKIEKELRSLCQRIEYEKNSMGILLKKAKDEGYEL